MKKLIYILMTILLLPFFVGCDKNNTQKWNLEWYINCTTEEKNTEFCNLNYLPVCWDNGETYWNKCFACASKNLNSYKTWECNCDAENWICSMVGDELQNEIDNGLENSGQEENVEQEEIPEIVVDVPVPNF